MSTCPTCHRTVLLEDVTAWGGWSIDVDGMSLHPGGVRLTRLEFRFVARLLRERGRVAFHAEVEEAIMSRAADKNALVKVMSSRLNKRVPGRPFVAQRGLGYYMKRCGE